MKKPQIEKVERTHKSATIWLENEAHIKHEKVDGSIYESIFAPDDPHSAWEINDVGYGDDEVFEYSIGWLEWYLETPVEEIAEEDFHKHLLGGRK